MCCCVYKGWIWVPIASVPDLASSFRVTEEDRFSETAVWPTLFLLNVSTSLKGTHNYILFDVTAAGVVPCGIPKKRPCTSSIAQFIFYFWSFEIS